MWFRLRHILGLGLFGIWGGIALLMPQSGDTQDVQESAKTSLSMLVTIAQIAQPLQAIVGNRWHIDAVMGTGMDPHLYRPTRSDISSLLHADMVIWMGPELEAQIARPMARLKQQDRVVTLLDHVADRDMIRPYDGSQARDPHIWMDPLLWGKVLGVAVEKIAARDPLHAAEYRARLAQYQNQLRHMDRWIVDSVQSIPHGQNVMITAHDAFTYFGRRYGIEVMALQGLTTESEAGLYRIEELATIATRQRIPAVFAETSVSRRHVHALIEGCAAQGHELRLGEILYSDAMGKKDDVTGTYVGMIEHNTRAIVSALGGTSFFPSSLAARGEDSRNYE